MVQKKAGAPARPATRKPRKPRRPAVDLPPNHGGRPTHFPTPASRGLIRMLLVLGRTQAEVAKAAQLDEKTLRKHYRADLDTAFDETGAQLMQTAMLKALGGSGGAARWQDADTTMLIFLLKTRFGLKPPPQTHIVGHYDLSKLSDEQLASIESILAGAAIDGGDPSGEGAA